MAYDSERHVISVNCNDAVGTSASGATAATTTFGRSTMMTACTINDFNVVIGTVGDTSTSGNYVFVLQKSAAGTGAASAIGTATLVGTTGVANGGVIDGSVAITNMAEGDDLILVSGAGTALPADSITVSQADVLIAQGKVEF